MAFIPPLTPISYLQPPNQDVSEEQKNADDKLWWAQWGRWIVYTFWNPLRRNFFPGIDETDGRIHDRMLENTIYYFGEQGLKSLAYARPLGVNRLGTSVFIPDQKIRTLSDYMLGNVIEMVAPIKEAISATGLSSHIQSDRDELWAQLKAQYFLQNQGLEQMGISYKPLPDKQFDSLQDIDDFMEEWKHEYEKNAVAITKNIYYDQNLEAEFIDDGLNVIIGSLCSTLFEVENGKVAESSIPCRNAIYDFRAQNQYGKGRMIAGGVFHATPAELFAKFPQLTLEERDQINNVAKNDSENYAQDFCNYYNDNQQNILWWNRNAGTVSYAILYFIARKELNYKIALNSFGGKKVVNIFDQTDTGGKSVKTPTYAVSGKQAKTKDIAGTEWAWMVHKCVLIGNKIVTSCEYPPYQIRTGGPKTIPELPIVQMLQGSVMGYSRSVVDRLRQHADFRGLLMEKVQELVANDIGKCYFIRGSVMDGLDDPETLLKDLKTLKIKVITGASGEPNDPHDGDKMIEMIDMSLDPNIMNYIRLADNESRLMEEIVSIPAVALGTQTDVIGKGVQQRTITQATLGQKSFYNSLMEHYRQKLQYGFNVAKLLYTESPETVKLLPISEKETYLLKVTKKFRAEDVGIYIKPNDPIEAKDMQIFEQAILGFMQNINAPGALEGLKTSLNLIKADTYTDALDKIEKQIRLNKKSQALMQQAQAQATAQEQQQAGIIAQQTIMLQKQADFIREIEKLNTSKAWDYETAMAKLGKDLEGKIADAIIKYSHDEVAHARAQDLQQSQGQQQQQLQQQDHSNTMEQNDQLNQHAQEQQDNAPATAAV